MLTDANGEERKGIEVDMLAGLSDEGDELTVAIYKLVDSATCNCLVSGIEIGLSNREKETIRDLMLAGF